MEENGLPPPEFRTEHGLVPRQVFTTPTLAGFMVQKQEVQRRPVAATRSAA